MTATLPHISAAALAAARPELPTLRPYQFAGVEGSVALYLQQVGRALRPARLRMVARACGYHPRWIRWRLEEMGGAA